MNKRAILQIILLSVCVGLVGAVAKAEDDAFLAWQKDTVGPRVIPRGFVRFGTGLSYKAIAGGLGFQVYEDNGNMHIQQFTVVGINRSIIHNENSEGAVNMVPWRVARLGYVALEGVQGKGKMAQEDASWSRGECGFRYSASDGLLRVCVSRLCPGLLVRSNRNRMIFFGGIRPPSRFAFHDGKNAIVRRMEEGNGSIDISTMKEPWLLCWFGEKSTFLSNRSIKPSYRKEKAAKGDVLGEYFQADMPILFLFQRPPRAISSRNSGLTFELAPAKGKEDLGYKVIVIPLFGEYFPAVTETSGWDKGVPEDVVGKCRWWNEHLDQYPTGVAETYRYDEETDTITIQEEFEYEKFREGAKGHYAPIPPMAAIAHKYGFPIRFSDPAVATGVLTSWGPCKAIEDKKVYAWSIAGIGKYVLERPVVNSKTTEPPHLNSEMEKAVSDVVKAGHLAPYIPLNEDCAGREFMDHPEWSCPGDGLFHMARCYPLVSDTLKNGIREWMRRERKAYPPENVIQLNYAEGARRESYPVVNKQYFRHQKTEEARRSLHRLKRIVPVEGITALSAYGVCVNDKQADLNAVDAVLRPYLKQTDWASMGFFTWVPKYHGPWRAPHIHGKGSVMEVNILFNALVGYTRLARKAGRRDREQMGWGLFGKTAALRFAMGKYKDYLYDSGLQDFPKQPDIWLAKHKPWAKDGQPYFRDVTLFTDSWKDRLDDVRQIAWMDELGTFFNETSNMGDTSILLPFRDLTPELGRFLHDHLRPEARAYVKRVEKFIPEWYIKLCYVYLGSEDWALYIGDSHQIFMAKAWVLGEDGPSLEKYLDIPWLKVGDFFYMDKLAATMMAYRGVEWVKDGTN